MKFFIDTADIKEIREAAAMGLVDGVTTKVNYGLNKVRFPSPVKVGSRIRLVGKLAEVEEVPGGVQITVDGTVEIEGGGKPAAVLQSLSRFYA